MENMKSVIGLLICATAMLLCGIGRAQSSTTNIVPLVEMRQVPIGSAINNLARQAGINYLVDRRLVQTWTGTREPAATCKLQNLTARDALQQVLAVHKLALVENPLTGVARITPDDQPVNAASTNLLVSLLANPPASGAAVILPLIQFEEVPLDIALQHLVQQCEIKCDYSGSLRNADGSPWFASTPSVSFHWEKITAIQALFALCENYDLTISRDGTGTLHIEPARFKQQHHILSH